MTWSVYSKKNKYKKGLEMSTRNETRSGYRTAINEVSARVAELRAKDKTTKVSFVTECKNYALALGYEKWSDLADELKKEDKAKNICWNCDHHADTEIIKCTECGRVGKSKYTVLNSRNKKDDEIKPKYKAGDFIMVGDIADRIIRVTKEEDVFKYVSVSGVILEEDIVLANAKEIEAYIKSIKA